MAAPAIQTSSESASSNVFTKPTGLADGDVLYILYWSFHSTAAAPVAPTGFTEVASGSANYVGNERLEARIYRKVITNAAGEPANYTVTQGGGSNFGNGGEIFRVSGADTTTPENADGENNGNSGTASTGSITTTNAECLLLAAITTNGVSIAVPSGMAALYLHDGGDAEGYQETLSATLTGATRTSTLGSSQFWAVGWVAVQSPSAAATTAPPPWPPAYRLQPLLGR